MRSSKSSCVTGLRPHTSDEVTSLGREHHGEQPCFSPSSYSWRNPTYGLESLPSSQHASARGAGKIICETNSRKATPDYLASKPDVPLNIEGPYPDAEGASFSLDNNLRTWYTRQDQFNAFPNCNCQLIEHQDETIDSIRGSHCGDEIASRQSNWFFNDGSHSLSKEMYNSDEIPSLSRQRCYGDEIPSLSSKWHCGSQAHLHSGKQSYGDEIPSLSRQLQSSTRHWQGTSHKNGYLKGSIAGKVGCTSQQVGMSKNEHAFTKPRMANRAVSSSNYYMMNKKKNIWSSCGDLSDQIRGPRATKMNSGSSSSVKKDVMSPLISRDHFNRSDFPVQYEHAKFFMIKSHCEDDIHKGIKYNVWASTSNGNNKLDAAFHEAHILMKEKGTKCPIFLFFSVNTSGRFVGLAEMLGPVDFKKTMDFWLQDKWNGFFPVTWHIVKDIPNRHLQHITLENNDNRMVTFCRDTQEIPLRQGLQMLEIFKCYPLGTSILDDFDFYEEKEHSHSALRRNSQSMHEAKLPDDSKSMVLPPSSVAARPTPVIPNERLELGMQNLSFRGTKRSIQL